MNQRRKLNLDVLTSRHTAFPRFQDLVSAGGNYRPSLGASKNVECEVLAGAYDKAQELRGDQRRALRY